MSELNFKGKKFFYNYHLTVPHRPLTPDADKSVGAVRPYCNLIVQDGTRMACDLELMTE